MKAKISSDNIPQLENIYKKVLSDFLKDKNAYIKESMLLGINLHGKSTLFFKEVFGEAGGEDFKGNKTNYNMYKNIDSNCFIIQSNSPYEQGFVTIDSAFIFNLGIQILQYANKHGNNYNLKNLEFNFEKSDKNE